MCRLLYMEGEDFTPVLENEIGGHHKQKWNIVIHHRI